MPVSGGRAESPNPVPLADRPVIGFATLGVPVEGAGSGLALITSRPAEATIAVVAVGDVVGLVVVVVLVALGVLVVVKGRRRKGQGRAVSGEVPVPRLRVVALGVQGSGKTVLLTGMYRKLQSPGDRGFHLKVPFDQLIELNRWYREVAGSDTGWPAGTTRKDMREFDFGVMTTVGDRAATVFDIGYLEYPGELLTDPDAPGSTAQQQLLAAVPEADALIGIIDGLRVLQAHQGDRRGLSVLHTTLDAMVHCMLTVRAPIAFVITKWDVLDQLHEDENTRLEMVRDLLMEVDGFRDLVTVHSARRVVRLIPVTAVGHDFAVLDGGTVRKRPDGRFQPANVELVLSAVVPDVLQQVELAVDVRTRQAIMAEAQRRLRVGPAEALRTLTAFVAERATKAVAATAGGFTAAGLALLLESRAEPDPGYQERLSALDEADRWAEEFIQARRRVVRRLQDQVAVFEGRLPASRLRGDAP